MFDDIKTQRRYEYMNDDITILVQSSFIGTEHDI